MKDTFTLSLPECVCIAVFGSSDGMKGWMSRWMGSEGTDQWDRHRRRRLVGLMGWLVEGWLSQDSLSSDPPQL